MIGLIGHRDQKQVPLFCGGKNPACDRPINWKNYVARNGWPFTKARMKKCFDRETY